MTLPVLHKRSTAARRRQQRAEFQALKARVATNPSPETLKRRAKSRSDNERARAKDKLDRALAGAAIRGVSASELAKLRPAEHDMLREEAANRIGALTAEERKTLQDRWYLAVVCFSVEQLRAIAVGLR